MKHATKAVAATCAAGVVALLSACGASPTSASHPEHTVKYTYNSGNMNASYIEGANLSSLGPVPHLKNVRIGVVLKSLTNQYWQQIEAGIKAAASHYGVSVNIQAASSEQAPSQQLNIAQTMANQGYSAFIVSPETSSNMTPVIKALQKKNIPIVNTDDARVNATVFVGPDHALDGSTAAHFLSQKLPSGSQVALIEGLAGSTAAILRGQGFNTGIHQTSLKVVAEVPGNWSASMAYADARDLMTRFPNLKGIYAENDTMATAVARAVAQAHKTGQIDVVGTDGIPLAVSDIKNGTEQASITPFPYYEGYWSVEVALRLLGGQKVPPWVKAPATLITPQNVNKYFTSSGLDKTTLFK